MYWVVPLQGQVSPLPPTRPGLVLGQRWVPQWSRLRGLCSSHVAPHLQPQPRISKPSLSPRCPSPACFLHAASVLQLPKLRFTGLGCFGNRAAGSRRWRRADASFHVSNSGEEGTTSAAHNQPAVCSSAPDNRAEILRLRRRFLKDQEKLSLIYARKGVVEQKREKVCTHFWNSVGNRYFCHRMCAQEMSSGWPRPDRRDGPCDPTSRCPLSPTALLGSGRCCSLWTDRLSA